VTPLDQTHWDDTFDKDVNFASYLLDFMKVCQSPLVLYPHFGPKNTHSNSSAIF